MKYPNLYLVIQITLNVSLKRSAEILAKKQATNLSNISLVSLICSYRHNAERAILSEEASRIRLTQKDFSSIKLLKFAYKK